MKNLLIHKTAALCLLLLLLSQVFISCEGLDSYSTSPNHQLRFSTDTLSFDTVFTTIGSATRSFMVYNQNNEALKISSIELANGGKNGFRINVDGRKGTSFKDIDIWKKDSLYILVEVTVDPSAKNHPMLIEDSILFYTNGVRQSVLLQAYGQDVHILKGWSVFSTDTTLTADLPYLIYDSVEVNEGVTLTIEKGVTFYMHHQSKVKVSGTIKALGTQDDPIVFRGDRLDSFQADGLDIPYDRISGQWDGIYFASTSFDNVFDFVEMRNGYSGLTFKESQPDKLKINIRNSQVTNMDYNLLHAVNCYIEASNSEFTNAVDSTIALIGGKYQFTHCTMANYKNWGNSRVSAPCLILANFIKNESKSFPLQQAYFDNCIIDGTFSPDSTKLYKGEIKFVTQDTTEHVGSENFNYRFRSSFIKTARVHNDRFIDNLFIKSPTYLKKATKETVFECDFRLANESIGIGKANRTLSEEYPVDRYGINRLTSETGPSIGAYEYVYQEEEKEKK